MSTNYMSLKDEELKAKMGDLGLEEADFTNENKSLNRKKLVGVLKMVDMQIGKATETLAIKEDGNIVDHKPAKDGKLHKSLSGVMVEITFYSTEENDLPYVQLALNGIALIIPRELKTWIPKEFIDGVLQNAIMTKMKMNVSGAGKITYIPKQVPRFQHTVHDIKHIDVLRKEYDEMAKKGN